MRTESRDNSTLSLTMTDDEPITVDARTGDEKAENEDGMDLETPDPDADVATDEIDLDERGNEEAKRRLRDADGDDQYEQAVNASAALREDLEGHTNDLAKRQQMLQQSRRKIERLVVTIDRIDETPDDALVQQELAGGVTVEVPPEADDGFDRADLVDDLEETKELHEERIDRLEENVENMKTEVRVLQTAFRELQKTKEMLAPSE